MKKAWMVLALLLLATPAFANKQCVINNTTVVNNINDDEALDYGAYLDLVVLETKATEWGLKTTWLQESQEGRVYIGGKIYLNRLVKK